MYQKFSLYLLSESAKNFYNTYSWNLFMQECVLGITTTAGRETVAPTAYRKTALVLLASTRFQLMEHL